MALRRAFQLLLLGHVARAPWQQVAAPPPAQHHATCLRPTADFDAWHRLQGTTNKRLVLDVNFETSKDYDITSAYAVRGWNTTEGHMKVRARHLPVDHVQLPAYAG